MLIEDAAIVAFCKQTLLPVDDVLPRCSRESQTLDAAVDRSSLHRAQTATAFSLWSEAEPTKSKATLQEPPDRLVSHRHRQSVMPVQRR